MFVTVDAIPPFPYPLSIFIYEASNLLKRIELTSKGVVLGYAIFEILLLITT